MVEIMDLVQRPRRNRQSKEIRALVRETELTPSDLIWPLFVVEGKNIEQPIASMPGVYRRSIDKLIEAAKAAHGRGIPAVALFPALDDALKTPTGKESLNAEGLLPRCVHALKSAIPSLLVITDVALDPYSSDGHDGIVKDGKILNDESVSVLVKMAEVQCAAGADLVAPSDMMDGRIGAIREALDNNGYSDRGILAYTAKYASAFYGPFRDALESAPKFGDKKTYQMDPANTREALRELELDLDEGADIVMVKPALPYLDIIQEFSHHSAVPVAAYQVSGEYSMICAAAQNGWLDRKAAALEALMAIRRAGANMILTYFADEASEWLS